jgi:SAM-dependent methyltransferase
LSGLSARLKRRYQRESFFPTWLGVFINPFYFARKGLAGHIADLADQVIGKTLDVGCGSKPYESLYAAREYIGLEYDTPENRAGKKADFFYDGEIFPFQVGSFDSVVANEVFEHVFNPDRFLDEVHRVLKPGGRLLMTMPFVWDEHEQPHDYARYSSFGIRYLVEKHGFEIVEQRKSVDDARVIFQLINAWLYKKTVTRNGWLNLALTVALMAPFNLLGLLAGWLLPRNPDLYLDNIVLARKP